MLRHLFILHLLIFVSGLVVAQTDEYPIDDPYGEVKLAELNVQLQNLKSQHSDLKANFIEEQHKQAEHLDNQISALQAETNAQTTLSAAQFKKQSSELKAQLDNLKKMQEELDAAYLAKQSMQSEHINEQFKRLQAESHAQTTILTSKFNEQNKLIEKQIELTDGLVAQRQKQIDYIKRQNSYQYFKVEPGSFKETVARFAKRIGVRTVRYTRNIPACLDWEIDSGYKIDIRNKEKALQELFIGLPLIPSFKERDNSINIDSLKTLGGCDA